MKASESCRSWKDDLYELLRPGMLRESNVLEARLQLQIDFMRRLRRDGAVSFCYSHLAIKKGLQIP